MTPEQVLQNYVAAAVNAGQTLHQVLELANIDELKGMPYVADCIRFEYSECRKKMEERKAEWEAYERSKPTLPPPPTPSVYVAPVRKKAKADNPIARRRRFRREAYVISADPPAIRDAEIWKRIPEAPDYSFSNYHQVKRTRAVKGSQAGTVIVPGFGKKGHTRWKLVVGKGQRKTFYAFKLAGDLDFTASEED